MCFFRRRKQANLKAKQEAAQKVEPKEEKVVKAPKEEKVVVERKVETKPEEKKVTPEPVEKKAAPEPIEENAAPEPVAKKEVDKPAEKEDESAEGKKTPPKYHVSQNKNQKSEHYKKWRVRLAGSDKTIKFYDTQKEAIEAAKEFAENNDGSVVIHKVDGSIRKQDYTKKS